MDYIRLWTYYRPNWPVWFYAVLLIALGLVIGIAIKKQRRIAYSVGAYLLTVYLFYILSITLLNRSPFDGLHYEPQVFWSYKRILAGDHYFIEENFLNVLMLLPVGILLPIVFRVRYKGTFLTALFITLAIESMQYVTQTGLFEYDDIIHNTVGAMIGYGMFKLCDNLNKNKKKSKIS